MKEHPILFNGAMVRATLEGRKTQTRRVMKPQPKWNPGPNPGNSPGHYEFHHKPCPYGIPGDRLKIKETHFLYGYWFEAGLTKTGKIKWEFNDIGGSCKYLNDPPKIIRTFNYKKVGWYKRPSIFMKLEYSRILLEVTDIRVERVQDISTNDVSAEGIDRCEIHRVSHVCCSYLKKEFEKLWNSINEKRGFGWDKNPWVWVVGFKVLNEG